VGQPAADGSKAIVPLRQVFPHLIENPFVGAAAKEPAVQEPARQQSGPQMIENPFVGQGK
jgi:hypothetical protein